jgi:gliding motility-associated-like protein
MFFSGIMRKQLFLLLMFAMICCLLFNIRSFSQNVLAPYQPEQDACNALRLCGGVFFAPYSYQGVGKKTDIMSTPCNPSHNGAEYNSVWIRVSIATSGVLAFSIIPIDTLDDYGFAIFDATNITCGDLSQANVVRCNYDNNQPGSKEGGIVGLRPNSTVTYVTAYSFGNAFCKAIDAVAGQTYLILIDNYGNDSTLKISAGFRMDFSGSTATFVNDQPPALDSIVKECSDTSVTVQLNSPVLCSSIAADGSDFYVTPSIAISSATGMNCIIGNRYTWQVTIYFSGHALSSNYVLHAREGIDMNTLLDFCNDPMLLPASLPFVISPPLGDNLLPAEKVKCFYSTISVGPEKEFESYLWSTGQTTTTIQVTNPGIYTLIATDTNGCTGMGSITVKDSACPQYLRLPTAFTPNGDGKNDIFRPIFAGAMIYFKLTIYDRWGERIFESSSSSQGWDGTFGGKPQSSGTYVWLCKYRLYQQPEQVQKGTVVLIR